MHELSVALGIVRTVSECAAERGIERIEAVHIRIGEISGVDPGALTFAWEIAAADSVMAGSHLTFEDVALRIRCPSCGVQRHPPSRRQLACPTCPSISPDIVAGRELDIISFEIPLFSR